MRRSGTIVWREIEEALGREIADSMYPSGTKFPPESDLAARFGVNRRPISRPMRAASFNRSATRKRGRFIFLDTIDPGVHTAFFCEKRQAWLAKTLDDSKDRPVFLFMHHPPFEIALPHLDQYVMTNGDAFARIVAGHTNIRHIFFGHAHRPVCGSWRGFSFLALRGTNHQSWQTFETTRAYICSHEPPVSS